MTFSEEMRSVADELIGELGKDVTLRWVESEYDPVAGETTEETRDVSLSVTLESYSVRQQETSLVEAGDLQVTIPAQALAGNGSTEGRTEPSTEDRVLIDGHQWSVQRVDPVYAGNDPVIYQLQIRR